MKSRVKRGLGNIKALAAVINEEANHPGRPSPHMAARNPMWGGEDTPVDDVSTKEEDVTESSEVESNATESEGEAFWFLNYDDVDGWDATNPNEEK